jgi:hypothetical protein
VLGHDDREATNLALMGAAPTVDFWGIEPSKQTKEFVSQERQLERIAQQLERQTELMQRERERPRAAQVRQDNER